MFRHFLAALALCVSAFAAKPNIVFILTDDLGVNDLRCYGRADHNTPNLDRLASEGRRYTSAYCAQPICSPSRAAILTGKAPARLHITTFLPGRTNLPPQKLLHPEMRQQLPPEERTLAEYLKDAGYVTGYIGKWHLGGKGALPTDQGFDSYHPGQANTKPTDSEGGKGEYDLTRAAQKFLVDNRSRPFFLYLSHNTPHIVYTARTNLVSKNARAFEPVYAAVIETLDDSIGQLLKTLDDLQLRTNTIVVFTSDNGGLHVPEAGHQRITHNRPFRAGKGFLYEGGLRIPLIVRWPGRIPAGEVTDRPVINTDFTPTFLKWSGIETKAAFDGLPLDSTQAGERTFYWHFPHYTNQGSAPAGAVRRGDWKLIEHYEDGRVELFNLRDDISETRNLAEAQPDRTRNLRSALSAWRTEVSAQTNQANPSFSAPLHRAIYLDYDISRYDPPTASPEEFQRVLAWRKLMDEAVRNR